MDKKENPLPLKQLMVVMIVGFSEGMAGTLVLPFIVFMILDFGYPENKVGIYAGILTSSFYLMQFISVIKNNPKKKFK